MAFLTGMDGDIKIDGQTLHVKKWSANPTCGTDETTNTGSGGFFESIPTIKKLTGKCDANWDAAAPPGGVIPGIIEGADIALKLYIGDSGDFINMPHATILGVPLENDAKTGVTFSFDFESNGPYTMPS